MKDAASRIAGDWIRNDTERNERAIRSAIRRAVKAERERCVAIVQANTLPKYVGREAIVEKINTPAKKPSKRKGRR